MICCLNGQMCPVGDARIDPQDRGFLLGDGIFETLLAVDGSVQRAQGHLARLFGSAARLGLSVPFPKIEIMAMMMRVLRENRLLTGRAALRITLTRGIGPRGVAPPADAVPTFLLTAAPLGPAPQTMRAIISSHIRNEHSISSQIKSLNYLDNILARREAVQSGADEALMRNSAGNIACASAANIFAVADGALYTPSAGDGALPGVLRAAVMEAGAAQNILVHERPVAPAMLATAAEIFLTSALIGVCPLIEIGGMPAGGGVMGPVTRLIRTQTNPG